MQIYAIERVVTDSIRQVLQLVDTKKTEVGIDNILVVFDFDNTLMAMNQDLGSDQWYNWQSGLLGKVKPQFAVAKTKEELFEVSYKLMALSKMHAVELDTVKVVQEIQKSKVKSIILTSRGPYFRNDTELELQRIGLNFKDSAIGPSNGYAGVFKPVGLEGARDISYMDGIIMGSGQNKGQILKLILDKTNSQFKVIIFIDDSLKNIQNMENQSFKDTQLYTFYYTYEESKVKKFEKNKDKAIKSWKRLKTILDTIFDET